MSSEPFTSSSGPPSFRPFANVWESRALNPVHRKLQSLALTPGPCFCHILCCTVAVVCCRYACTRTPPLWYETVSCVWASYLHVSACCTCVHACVCAPGVCVSFVMLSACLLNMLRAYHEMLCVVRSRCVASTGWGVHVRNTSIAQ